MQELIVIVVASTLAGVGTGFAGLSAAVFIAPMLTVFLNVDTYEAVGVALAADVLASAFSAVTYAKHGNIDLRRGKVLALSVFACTIIGSMVSFLFLNLSIGNSVMTYWMIAATLVLGIHFILQFGKREEKDKLRRSFPALAVSLLGGAYIGFVCGVQGTGGGLMLLFVLNTLLRFEFRTAVGTSVCIMSVTALIGAGTHFAINGLPDLKLLVLCAVVTLITAELAAVLANRMKPRVLKLWTGILMTGSGVIMLLEKLV